jgi:hypothetical protein
MRPIFALAILMVGVKAAVPEATNQTSQLVAGQHGLLSSFQVDAAIGDTDRKFVLAVPSESSDAPHHQGEDAADPPQPPAPASTGLDVEEDTADSIDTLCKALLVSAEDNGLPVPFFANLIWQESRLRHDAVSPVGALGIAQFMPEVAVEVGLGDPFDPHQAIPASARFLHGLREQFGNLGFVAAAYNAGAHRVAEWLNHGRALPRETQTYIVRVTGRSAETWRKSPPDDSQLTFVRPLPCRELPAFADVEQTRLREAQQVEETHQQSQQEKTAATVTAKAAANAPKRVAPRFALKMKRPAPVPRSLVAERKDIRRVARVEPAEKVARNFHGSSRHDAARREHAPHDKRRIA